MVASTNRRDFLRVAAGTGILALAGCLGGSDGDAGPTGENPATTSGTTAATPTTVAGVADTCESLTAGGFTRYDARGKPLLVDFEHPRGWNFRETDIDSAFSTTFFTELELPDDDYTFGIQILLGKEPVDPAGYDVFLDSGWEAYEFDLNGNPANLILSPEGYIDSSFAVVNGQLPFESAGEVTLHTFAVSVSELNRQGVCEPTLRAIRDHIVQSFRYNPDHTFARVLDE